MPFATVNGTRLFYEDHGSGPAIVFAHGRGGNHLSWWRQVSEFQAGHRCITFDQRGWGLSEGPAEPPDPGTVTADLVGLLDYLGIESAVLVAQSMGGVSSLGVALHHPERVAGLVLADTTGGVGDASVISLLADVHPPEDPFRRALSDSFIDSHPDLTFLFGSIGRINQPMPVTVVSGLFQNPDGPHAADLARMNVPTLLVVGEEDKIFPVHVIQAVQRLIPGGRIEVVPGAAHSTHFEQADVFNGLLREFIASLRLDMASAADN